jgi:hypothetical protein
MFILALIPLQQAPPLAPFDLLRSVSIGKWEVYECVSNSTPPINGYVLRQGIVHAKLTRRLDAREARTLREAILSLGKSYDSIPVVRMHPTIIVRASGKSPVDILMNPEARQFSISRPNASDFGPVFHGKGGQPSWQKMLRLLGNPGRTRLAKREF